MKYSIFLLLSALVLGDQKHLVSTVDVSSLGGLKILRKKGVVRFLTVKDPYNYFIYKGGEHGREYSMAKAFVSYLNNQVDFGPSEIGPRFHIIPVEKHQLIPYLLSGRGDIIAAGLGVSKGQKLKIRTSYPYQKEESVFYMDQAAPDLDSLEGLSGRLLYIRTEDPHVDDIANTNKILRGRGSPLIKTHFYESQKELFSLFDKVSKDKNAVALIERNLAEIWIKLYRNAQIKTGILIDKKRNLVWGVREDSKDLLEYINKFMLEHRKGNLNNGRPILSFFNSLDSLRHKFENYKERKISPYDDLFKKYGEMYNFDWRLVTALSYQESRFTQDVINEYGAIGIMQVKQMTAQEPYVAIPKITGNKNLENNIHAGVKYLRWLKDSFFSNEDINGKDQLFLTMASYNGGPGTVLNAGREAKNLGLLNTKWWKNVETGLLLMNKLEPVFYIRDIHKRYVSYVLLGF